MTDPVSTACERCGAFAERKPYWGKQLCDACIGRAPALFREPPRAGNLLPSASDARMLGTVLLLSAVADFPFALADAYAPNARGLSFLDFVVSVYLGGAAVHMVTRHAVDPSRPIRVSESIGEAGRRFGALFRSSFVAYFLVAIMSLLLLVPGVLRYLSYAITVPMVMFEPYVDVNQTLKGSTQRMQGHRWAAFGAYFVTIGVPMLLAALVLIVDLIIRGDPEAEHPAWLTLLAMFFARAASSTASFVTAKLYLKLTPPALWPLTSGSTKTAS